MEIKIVFVIALCAVFAVGCRSPEVSGRVTNISWGCNKTCAQGDDIIAAETHGDGREMNCPPDLPPLWCTMKNPHGAYFVELTDDRGEKYDLRIDYTTSALDSRIAIGKRIHAFYGGLPYEAINKWWPE